MIKSTHYRNSRYPGVQKYILEDQDTFNVLLKSYNGNKENEWISISKIGLVGSKIYKDRSLDCNKI